MQSHRIESLEARRLFASGLLQDIYPGGLSSSPLGFTAVGQQGYFFATDSNSVTGLYKTGGTPSTTARVADVLLSPIGLPPVRAASSDKLFYVAQDSQGHDQLYRSNGTLAGTFALTDGPDITFDITWTGYTEVKALAATKIIFTAPAHDALLAATHDLYITDGNSAATLLASLPANTAAVPPNQLTVAGSNLYFVLPSADAQSDVLWKTDGTANSAQVVMTFPAGERLSNLAASGSTLYFVDQNASGWALWRSADDINGTAALTAGMGFIPDPTLGGPISYSAASVGNNLYFTAQHSTLGTALWQTDGTPGSVTTVDAIPPVDPIIGLNSITAWQNGVLWFQSDSTGTALRSFRPSFSSTHLVSAVDGIAYGLIAAGSKAYFSNTDVAHGAELWQTDGTLAGTQIAADDMPGPDTSLPNMNNAAALGSSLLYAGTTGNEGTEPRRAPVTEVSSVAFQYNTPRQQLEINFPQPIDPATLTANDISLIRTVGGNLVIFGNQLAVTFNASFTQAIVRYTGAANGVLPDGQWTMLLSPESFSNSLGVPNFASSSLNFYTLGGDADRSGTVNLSDLVALSTNWQTNNKDFAHADFNYDGTVNLSDLVILSNNWQKNNTTFAAALGAASMPSLDSLLSPPPKTPVRPAVRAAIRPISVIT